MAAVSSFCCQENWLSRSPRLVGVPAPQGDLLQLSPIRYTREILVKLLDAPDRPQTPPNRLLLTSKDMLRAPGRGSLQSAATGESASVVSQADHLLLSAVLGRVTSSRLSLA